MKSIANVIFKIHRKIFGYPARSEVRLVLEFTNTCAFGLTSNIGMLYICGENIYSICEWTGLKEQDIKDELNSIVDSVK